ncbi:major facilitator superfamily MFS_1 [Paenibacillus curdlanolyticus YK9]|uniref:Major facilitator superfamily MFS_1 n=1 Tax=Paenibacillus curdlanolyticus YK9 TaxID=717606 RepID=E0I3L7_9BACL|nr:MFS transporter [Paenibacillus curdlanolyticus]EFM12881.1 major facilitator superfamily MFS_1 [Paenibacillus curdlanolyticus YK9]
MSIGTVVAGRRKVLTSPFVIQLLIIMFFVEFVKGALIVSILPVYMGTVLGLSAYAIGWALALQYIGDNAFRSPLGWIIDRVGYRTVMLFGVLLTFASVIIVTVTDDLPWIICACVLIGMGTSPLWPCVITGATAVAGNEAGGTIMGVVYMAWLTGVGAGPIVINFFIAKSNESSSSYDTAFKLLIALMVIVLFVALFLPGRTKSRELEGKEEQANPEEHEHLPLGERIRAYLAKVSSSMHASKVLYPAMFLQNFALGLLVPILTLYARTVLHLTPQQYSYYLLAGGAFTVLGLIPIGKAVDKYGTSRFLHIGFPAAAISLPLLGYTRDLVLVLPIVALVGLSYAFIIPAWNALIAEAIPKEERGAVWGFFLTIEGLGMVLGSIMSGKMWDSFGPHSPFLVSGVVLITLFVLHLFITRKPKVMVR